MVSLTLSPSCILCKMSVTIFCLKVHEIVFLANGKHKKVVLEFHFQTILIKHLIVIVCHYQSVENKSVH